MPKPEHQVGSERHLAGGKRSPDGQPFPKVVQPDADGDEERQRHALGRAALPAAGGEKDNQREHRRRPEERGGAKPSDGAFGHLETLADGVKKQKRQQADGQTKKEAPHAGPGAAHGGMEGKADGHRHDAHHEADERQRGEARRGHARGRRRHLDRVIERGPVLVRMRSVCASPATQG